MKHEIFINLNYFGIMEQELGFGNKVVVKFHNAFDNPEFKSHIEDTKAATKLKDDSERDLSDSEQKDGNTVPETSSKHLDQINDILFENLVDEKLVDPNRNDIEEGHNKIEYSGKADIKATLSIPTPKKQPHIDISKQQKVTFEDQAPVIRNIDYNIKSIERFIIDKAVSNISQVSSTLKINMFPGKLHLAFTSLENLEIRADSYITLVVWANDRKILSTELNKFSLMKMNQMLSIPVKDSNSAVSIKMEISDETKEKGLKLYNTAIEMKSSFVRTCHNNLREIESSWDIKSTSGIGVMLGNWFKKSKKSDIVVRMYACLFSDQEMPCTPKNLLELSKWITVKKYSCMCLFEGDVNIKGADGYRWAKQHIKWYGYCLYIFDLNRKYITHISLMEAVPQLDRIDKGMINFNIRNHLIGIHCDTGAMLRKCMDAVYLIFPQSQTRI